MKVIIAGSRDIYDHDVIHEAARLAGFRITEIVCGMARGVDRESLKCFPDIPHKPFEPDWKHKGRIAGFLRNADMASYADALIAIWDGQSHGTKDMIDNMRKMNKPFYIFRTDKPNIFGVDSLL